MFSRARLPLALFITGRKLLSAKINSLALAAFMLLLAYLWVEDSFSLSFKAFLYLSPFLSLLFSQDMMNDEVHSGALENVLFIGGRFRTYLLVKNAFVASSALGLILPLFFGFVLYSLATGQFEARCLGQLAAGVLVGVYYVAVAGFLSFLFKAGSNVLIILLGQVLLFVCFLSTASQRMGLVERLMAPSLPGVGAKLEFLAVSFVLPNMAIARLSWFPVFGLGAMSVLFFSLQVWQIHSLELRKR